MVRRGSARVAVILGVVLGAASGAPADEPPPGELVLPPLSVPAPPVDPAPPGPSAPTSAALPPVLDSLPPLGAPVSAPVAPAPVAAAPVIDIPPDRRPVLVVPGLPTPGRTPPASASARPRDAGVLRLPTGRQDGVDRPSAMGLTPTALPAVAAPEPIPDGPPPLVPPAGNSDPLSAEGPPPLVPPSGAGATTTGRPRLESPSPRYATDLAPGTLTLEPSRGEDLSPLPARGRAGSNTVEARVVDEPPAAPRAPSRRRLFGLFRPSPPASAPIDPPPSPIDAGEPSRIDAHADETIRVQPRSDPAADAALKRRLEAQIRSAMGNQLRALDVRVVDRTVYVRAAVTRFWQKRSARRTLETLPALAGYHTRIEVLD